jgi:hypothetical protein
MGQGGLLQISGYPMEAAQYPETEGGESRKVSAASRIVGDGFVRLKHGMRIKKEAKTLVC